LIDYVTIQVPRVGTSKLHRVPKKRLRYSRHVFGGKFKYIVILFGMSITITLCSADVIMTSSKMPVYCIRSEKASNVPVDNFNKFKRTFAIFGRQH